MAQRLGVDWAKNLDDALAILAEKFCQELLAPVLQQYGDERDRILGEGR